MLTLCSIHQAMPGVRARFEGYSFSLNLQAYIGRSVMTDVEAVRDHFARLVEMPENEIDLVEGALLIARTAHPEIVSSRYAELLDCWADRLRQRMDTTSSPGKMLQALNRILFEEEGLRGNSENYYDPRNSFLNRVMERKLGIPITLSLIYSEVGRRAGFPVYGYALPGHFMAGLMHTSGMLYVDTFNEGEILGEKECRERLAALYGGRVTAADSSWKIPASKRSILCRMLRNLKGIYRQLGNDLNCLEMIQWILCIEPDAPAELKDRGFLYETMGNDAYALRDLEHYLKVAPQTEDNETVVLKIQQLRKSKRWMH
jgi:regulator of sirC expression with transglutaminase-like and TPR domain